MYAFHVKFTLITPAVSNLAFSERTPEIHLEEGAGLSGLARWPREAAAGGAPAHVVVVEVELEEQAVVPEGVGVDDDRERALNPEGILERFRPVPSCSTPC